MRGNILTQTNWQVKAVFTLTVLFATTYLLLTNLFAGYPEGENTDRSSGWGFNGDKVWVESYVCTWYDAPFAKSCHYAYVTNGYKNKAVDAYYTFEIKVTPKEANNHILKTGDKGHKLLGRNGVLSKAKCLSLNMTGQDDGRYVINAFSSAVAKANIDNVRAEHEEKASTSTEFEK